VRGVLFDVDDTLVDHSGAARTAIVGYLTSPGLDHDAAAVDRWRVAEERHFSRHLIGELSVQGQRRARVRDALAPYGVADMDDATADAWFAGYTSRGRGDRSGAHRRDVPDGVTRVTSLVELDGIVA
jgi:putative hydrolase of the HAD superfamily